MTVSKIADWPGMRVDDIHVNGRHRNDLGDLSSLAASIEEHGLLNPVTVTRSGRLVAGHRRLEACKRLGWVSISVTEYQGAEETAALLRAEEAENRERKDMTASERVALAQAIEAAEKEYAKQRMAQAGASAAPGRPAERSARPSIPLENGTSIDKAASAVGLSRPTYARLKEIAQAANNDRLGDFDRQRAHEALALIDRIGSGEAVRNEDGEKLSITGVFEQWRGRAISKESALSDQLGPPAPQTRGPSADSSKDRASIAARYEQIRELAEQGHTSAQIAVKLGYKTAASVRETARRIGVEIRADKVIGRARRHDSNRVVQGIVDSLDGLEITAELIDFSELDGERLEEWGTSLSASITVLKRLHKQIREMTQ